MWNIDMWTAWHFLGSAFLCVVLYLPLQNILRSGGITLALGAAWEIWDIFKTRYDLCHFHSKMYQYIFCSDGFSITDLGADLIGTTLGCLVLALCTLDYTQKQQP